MKFALRSKLLSLMHVAFSSLLERKLAPKSFLLPRHTSHSLLRSLAVAGARKYIESLKARGDILDPEATFVAVASGANMDFDRLRYVSERADRSEVRLAIQIPEKPGAFRELYSKLYPSNVTEFAYRYNRPDRKADIIVAFQPHNNQWFQPVFCLNSAVFP